MGLFSYYLWLKFSLIKCKPVGSGCIDQVKRSKRCKGGGRIFTFKPTFGAFVFLWVGQAERILSLQNVGYGAYSSQRTW